MNYKKYISAIFLIIVSCSVIFAQQIERIFPYTNNDTTGVYLIFNGDINYEKKIKQSPPSITLIFPNTKLSEGNHQKTVDLPPLYRIEAKETISNRYFKHTKVDLYFYEIPEFRIDRIGENILRIIWSTEYLSDEYKIKTPNTNDSNFEIWSNFDNKVSMNLKNAELVDVLRLITMQSDMNLITNSKISGDVTLTLKEVSVGTALDAILKVNGYDWFIQDNLIVVKPIEDDIVGELVTKHYKLEHVDAYSIGTALKYVLTEKGNFQMFSPVASSSFFGSTQGQLGQTGAAGPGAGGIGGGMDIQSGAQSGAGIGGGSTIGGSGGMQSGASMMTADHILVTDVYSNFNRIDQIIKDLDIRVPQINISVKFIEIKLDVNERLGIDWSLRSEIIGPVPESETDVIDFESFKIFDSNKLSLYSFSIPAFNGVLELLASDGETRLIQEPQITTKNNTVAKFKVGTKYPILVTQTTSVSQTTTFDEKEISIILSVQPRINEDKFVSMDITTTVQALVGFAGPMDDQPIISDRGSTTHVRVEDQKTLMLGGMIFDQVIENTKRVPFISSIPLIGKLFTHSSHITEQRELLIFITPTIIRHQ
ncbi:MAG: type II and III secretion system protein [Candidatus Neomarinimicrobiota bacterium]